MANPMLPVNIRSANIKLKWRNDEKCNKSERLLKRAAPSGYKKRAAPKWLPLSAHDFSCAVLLLLLLSPQALGFRRATESAMKSP